VRRPIDRSTIVIVGATSGVGKATARSLAALGANLVLAARDRDALVDLVEECGGHGRALAVPGDVGHAGAAEAIADAAIARFGGIDTWINTASSLIVGQLSDVPAHDVLRIVETNVAGTALASRVAMRHFVERRQGVLINVSSMLAMIPNPLVPAYVMTKFAIRGLSLSLHEATAAHPGIRVCVVLPGPIDTPMFRHAANYTGRRLRAIPPAMSPERVAATVIRSIRRPRRQRTSGLTGGALMLGHHLAPRLVESATARVAAALVVSGRPAAATSGSLYHPQAPYSVGGGYRRLGVRRAAGDALGRWLSRRQ
jgi:short-subunit dehydrogenase